MDNIYEICKKGNKEEVLRLIKSEKGYDWNKGLSGACHGLNKLQKF